MTVKEIYYWCSLIMPPCFILPLAATPPDVGSSICWMAAGLLGIGSMFSITVKTVIILMRRRKKEIKSTVLIRPALTLLFILFSIFSVKSSLNVAKEFASSKAIEIQKICKTGKCPELIEGWTDITKNSLHYISQTMEGNLAKYAVQYRVFDDFKEFEVYLIINFDNFRLIANGGTEKELILTGK